MARTSIKDIARRAGVCIGTVSRVINNLDRVHPKTRARILALIEQTGYRPSSRGRALVSGRTRNILVVVHDIADPYCAALSKTFSREWHARGYRMLLGDSNCNPALEREHLLRARDGSVDGLVVSPCPGERSNAALYRQMMKDHFPFVAIDNRIAGVKTDCVKYDDAKAGSLAVDHLVARGHKHIAFLHSKIAFQTVRDRIRGFTQALRRHNLPLREAFLAPLPTGLPEADAAIRALMGRNPRPTAVIAENEIMALLCMNIVLQAGLKVPADLSIVSIGDTLPDIFQPFPLTTVALHHDVLCRLAVTQLHRQIEAASTRQPVVQIIKPDLIRRVSA